MTALTDTPFFRGITQTALPIRQYAGKSPMFFAGARIMGALFTVDAAAAQALMPHETFRVLATPLGRAYLGVFACEYGYTDIGPYNEVFLAVGLSRGAGWLAPLTATRRILARTLDAHVIQLPVDSEAALYGGLDYYNVPKYMARIAFSEGGGARRCEVRDPLSDELIFALTGTQPSLSLPLPFSPLRRQTLRNYSRLGGETIVARFELHAPAPHVRPGTRRVSLTLGAHPRSRMLAGLDPGAALGYFFSAGCEAILFAPAANPG
jgi:hypothetical protein